MKKISAQRYNVAGDKTATKTEAPSFWLRLEFEMENDADIRSA